MTPDKVRELVQWHMMSYPLCTTENVTRVVLSVLAEARKDARHAALTEAVASVDEAAAMPQGLSYDQRIAIKGVALRLLVLRDKEQP